VAAILAQMRGDAVGAGLDRGKGGADRIGTRPAPRITQGRDVIDIDAKAQRRSFGHGFDSRRKFRPSCAGSTRLRGRSPSGAAKARASIF
jgi:hypothetical protein